MGRTFFVGGNWKDNGTKESVKTIVENLNKGTIKGAVEVVVAPTFVHISAVQQTIRKEVSVAAQNCWIKGPGAFTGEISAEILVDLGLHWVILGHSERRSLLNESSQVVADKTKYALGKGLSVILCVGESLEEREANKTRDVVEAQLAAVASSIDDWDKIVVAYEPVWAIGTGKVATPDQAEEVHGQIRSWLQKNASSGTAEATRIIYGGSVSAKNCRELAQCPNIDGFLVGGASLKPEFLDIINSKA